MKRYFKIFGMILVFGLLLNTSFIFAQDKNDALTATSEVIAKGAVEGVKNSLEINLTKNELSLKIGDEFDLDVTKKIKGAKYRYTIENNEIASVHKTKGIVTATAEGETTVTCKVTTKDKKVITLECKVTVTK